VSYALVLHSLYLQQQEAQGIVNFQATRKKEKNEWISHTYGLLSIIGPRATSASEMLPTALQNNTKHIIGGLS
jgi:C-terminal processing protease CtpA/Prc